MCQNVYKKKQFTKIQILNTANLPLTANSNAQKNASSGGSNAAIISLLNSAPAAMTSSPVVNSNLTTTNLQPGTLNPTNLPPETLLNTKTIQQQSQIQLQQQPSNNTATIHHQAIGQNILTASSLRKILMPTEVLQQHQQQQQQQLQAGTSRVLNSKNIIAVSSAVGNIINQSQLVGIQTQGGMHSIITQQDVQQQHQQQQQQHQLHQQLNVRVTMSALASQLASPPALMSNATIQPQNFNFAQSTSVINTNKQPQQQQQQVILNSSNTRILGQQTQAIRRDSMTAPSPGSDSNASTASSSNIGFSMPGMSALLATSPTASSLSGGDGGPHSNISTSALMERLTGNSNNPLSHQSQSSPGPSPSSQFMSPSPKSNASMQQHIQVQSPASISPLSSPPPQQHQQQQQQTQPQQQTTTLNLQGINLSSLQGAMATFPHLQNVQVNIGFFFFNLLLSLNLINIMKTRKRNISLTNFVCCVAIF